MMYILLILFFTSLISIIIMIVRKLAILKQGHELHHEEVLFELPYLKEVKHVTIRGVRKYSYDGLVSVVRLYVKSINFLKNKYDTIKIKNRKTKEEISGDKKEISKFLKIIGEYKHKIREIKHRIHKEENL